MKLNKNQIVALLVLTLLVVIVIALLRNESKDILNIENSQIVIPAESN